MRFLTGAAAAAGMLTIMVSAASFAADNTQMQTSQAQSDEQMAQTVRDLQTRLDRDEQQLRQIQNQLPSPPSASHQFCSDGYDPYRGTCN